MYVAFCNTKFILVPISVLNVHYVSADRLVSLYHPSLTISTFISHFCAGSHLVVSCLSCCALRIRPWPSPARLLRPPFAPVCLPRTVVATPVCRLVLHLALGPGSKTACAKPGPTGYNTSQHVTRTYLLFDLFLQYLVTMCMLNVSE